MVEAEMREDLGDDVGVDDFGNDAELAGAAWSLTTREVFGKDAGQELGPAVAGGCRVAGGLRLGCLDTRRRVGSCMCREDGDLIAKGMPRRKDAKEAQHVDAGRRHERGESAQKSHGRQHHVGLAGVARAAQFIGDLAAGCMG